MKVNSCGVVAQQGNGQIHNTPGGFERWGQLFLGGYGGSVKLFPFNTEMIARTLKERRNSAEAGDWERVQSMVETQAVTITREECEAHRDELMAWVEHKENWWPTYARRNPVLYHAYDWIRALTTLKFIEGGVDSREAAQYPVKIGLDGHPFRKVYHPWASNHIIWLDWNGNEVGDNGHTWEQLLATGGPAEGIDLWFPTGTQEGHDAIAAYHAE